MINSLNTNEYGRENYNLTILLLPDFFGGKNGGKNIRDNKFINNISLC